MSGYTCAQLICKRNYWLSGLCSDLCSMVSRRGVHVLILHCCACVLNDRLFTLEYIGFGSFC
eukprot:m.383671 g.383671  ORF g.383671 m.383671 type:complete len:62 (+) comp129238_c0_seq1:26-211(+)